MNIDFGNLILTVLINILGGVITVFIMLYIFERKRRPRLTISREPEVYVTHDNNKFIRVLVKNDNMVPEWISWAYDSQPALMCQARIVFFYENFQVLGPEKEMIGRWSKTPNAMYSKFPTSSGEMTVLLNPESVKDWVDIPPGGEEILDIAAKFNADEHCQGWNNSAPNQAKWLMDKGQYYVKIVVQSGGRSFKECFRLINELGDFRIVPVADNEILKRLV